MVRRTAAGSFEIGGRARLPLKKKLVQAAVAILWIAGACAAQAQSANTATRPDELDPRAAKARLVLETHCARCHQRSMLRLPAPAADLGDILDLDRIAADPGLVVPGNADASLIYTLILRREMPSDVAWDNAREQAPASAELDALRDWIETIGRRDRARPDNVCMLKPGEGQPLLGAMIAAAVSRESEPRNLRFISLAHLDDTCGDERRLRGYRQAVTKLVNSLSRTPTSVRLEPIGEAGKVLQVRLSDLGWTAADWDRLVAGNPLLQVSASALSDGVREAIGTAGAIVPGDWLASRAMQPDVYAAMLGLADRLDDQLSILGVDRAKVDASSPPRRIGVRSSQVTRAHRMIELHARSAASVWLSYDFAGSEGRRDIFANPLGPGPQTSEPAAFKPDATRLMFALANGFPAFAVYDADGKRLETVPIDVEPAAPQRRSGGRAPASCMSCHDAGPRRAYDALRDAVTVTGSPHAKATRDAVEALHPPDAELQRIFAAESQRYRAALLAAGIDSDLTIDGIEMVTALARAWTRPVTMARAAAELGMLPEQIRQLADRADGPSRLTAARFAHGSVPRSQAVLLYAALLGVAPTSKHIPDAPDAARPSGLPAQLDLALVADQPHYVVGDIAHFSIRPSFDCNLTLISINPAGKATVIFPNDFEPDNALKAGQVLRVPSESSAYRLRLNQPGNERMVAVCTAQSRTADGIQQNYEQQRFTALGDWRNFLRALIDDDRSDRSAQDKVEARPNAKGTPAKQKSEPPRSNRLEQQARTSIDIKVEPRR